MDKTQKALFLESKFGQFNVREHNIPAPSLGQLLVRIEATGLNPADWKVRKYGIFLESYPAVIGTDVAGVVEQAGEGVSGFTKEDRVLFQAGWTNDKAGYQQYCLADAEMTAKIPSHVSFEVAATIPVAIAAALAGLYLAKPYGAGYTHPFDLVRNVLWEAAGSSRRCYLCWTIRHPACEALWFLTDHRHRFFQDFLKSLGATHVVDRHVPAVSLAAEVANMAPVPIEIVYDAVSLPDTQEAGYSLLFNGGHLILVTPTQIEVAEDKAIISVLGVWIFPYTRELGVQFYSKFTRLLDEGFIRPNRVEVLSGGLRGVVGGLGRLRTDQVSGVKLVIRPQETV